MPYIRTTCIECGQIYYPRKANPRNKYCSDKCSQKAYRQRRKKLKETEQHMIPFEAYELQQKIFTHQPDLKEPLLNLYSAHGKAAYIDLLWVMGVALGISKVIE